MKNLLLGIFAFFLMSNLFAQIQYTDYGDGWIIPMNANLALDVDEDGLTDFFLNQKEGDLGITTVPFHGCIIGTGYNDLTVFGSLKAKVFSGGENISQFWASEYYIEDDDIAAYTKNFQNGVFAEGWTNLDDHYIGFAILAGEFSDGWMKIAVDSEAETLIIKEIAYVPAFDGGINIGQTDITTSTALLENGLNNVSISPNPAKDFFNLNFDYTGDKILTISVLNSVGQKVKDLTQSRVNSTREINTANLAQGIYFVRFETEDGAHTEKLSINK